MTDNQRGVVLLQALELDGMTIPAGTEIDLGGNELETSLVAAGIARWGKGPVPSTITPLQALTAIETAGMKEVFDAVMAANPRAALMFSLTSEVQRGSAIVEGLRIKAGKTTGEIDDLFRLAGTLQG
jgi:hypothetical protein